MPFRPIGKISILGAQAFALALLLLITGCTDVSSDRPIRISANAWVGYEPLFEAESKRYFDEGAVDLIEAPFFATQEQAFRGTTIDASAVSLSSAFSLISAGHDITIVLVLDWFQGVGKVMASSKITTVADLRGKRIGIEPGSVSSYLLARALQNFSLNPSDVTVVPMMYERLTTVFQTGEIDAAAVFGPQVLLLEKSGAHSIFDSAKTPGEILDVLVVRTAYLRKNPKRVEQLVSGWLKGVASLQKANHQTKKSPQTPAKAEVTASVRDPAPQSLVHLSGSAENRSFLESDAQRLRAILSARLKHYQSMNVYLNMRAPPAIDPRPFLSASEIEAS